MSARTTIPSPFGLLLAVLSAVLVCSAVVSAQPEPPKRSTSSDSADRVPTSPADLTTPSPDGAWSPIAAFPDETLAQPRWIRPTGGQPLALNQAAIRARLNLAPKEGAFPVRTSPAILWLPRPDGSFERFAFVESSIMEPALQAQLPGIRTYLGQSLDFPANTTRFDLTPEGFHASVLGPADTDGNTNCYYIDPVSKGNTTHYTSYWRGDLRRPIGDWACSTVDPLANIRVFNGLQNAPETGAVTRRIVRTAVACTGEYTVFVSPPGNPNGFSAISAITTAINRVNQIYEIDVAVRLILAANSILLVNVNPATDPYSGTQADLQNQNQAALDARIGSDAYDLGHLFNAAGGGGNAGGIGTLCDSSIKGKGYTSVSSPTGDYFWIDYVAHEMGHQLGATHTFNNCGDNSQRTASTAYEPGSGISIMGYAGICNADDLATPSPPNGASIPVFNFSSIEQILNKVNNPPCTAGEATGNSDPVCPSIPDQVLPTNTPFILTGPVASDALGSLTYSWEQHDQGSAVPLGADTGAGEPLFRPFTPTIPTSRYFPRLQSLVSGTRLPGENLPRFPRNSAFSYIVRDNVAGAGGYTRVDQNIQFAASSGFRVLSPAAGATFCNSTLTVTWDPAGTQSAPINNSQVSIYLSTDGGQTFSTLLASAAPNTGSWGGPVFARSTNCRILVRGVQRPFYNVNSGNFTISQTPVITRSASNVYTCPFIDSAISFDAAFYTTVNWYKNGVLIADQHSTTLAFTPTQLGDFASYTAEIIGPCGTITHGPFTVSGAGAAYFISSGGTVNVCAGGSATFTTVAAGTGNSYSWTRNGALIPGASGPTLFQPSSANLREGDTFMCYVANDCTADSSQPFVVHIVPPLQSVVQNLQPQTRCLGGSATFTFVTSPPATLYRWYKNNSAAPFASTTQNFITLSPLSASDDASYYCIAENACSTRLASIDVRLTVIPPNVINPSGQPRSANLIRGQTATFQVSLSGWAPSASQWLRDGVPITNGGRFSGATSTQLSIANVDFIDQGQYTVQLTDPTCGVVTSAPAALAVDCNWVLTHPASTPPARSSPHMVFDSVRGRTVLFGGFFSIFARGNDTWEYDGETWTQIATPVAPSARSNAAIAFDATRGITYLFGGQAGSGQLNDTWLYDGVAWQPVGPQGTQPSPRAYCAALFNPVTDRFVIYGGASTVNFSSTILDEMWEFDPASDQWTQRTVDGPFPGPLRDASMVFDSARNVYVLVGGTLPGFNGPASQETWEFDGTAWSLKDTGSIGPRTNSPMSFDSVRNLTVLFGGSQAPQVARLWDGTSWTTQGITQPPNASTARMVFDLYRNRQVVFATNETYELTADFAAIASGPDSTSFTPGETLTLSATPAGPGLFAFQWLKDDVALTDNDRISGSTTTTLTITPAQAADVGSYTLSFTSSCGDGTSAAAQVTLATPPCTADINADGSVDGSDFVAFINSFAIGDVAIDPVADVNHDGTIDGNDFVDFINGFAVGC